MDARGVLKEKKTQQSLIFTHNMCSSTAGVRFMKTENPVLIKFAFRDQTERFSDILYLIYLLLSFFQTSVTLYLPYFALSQYQSQLISLVLFCFDTLIHKYDTDTSPQAFTKLKEI